MSASRTQLKFFLDAPEQVDLSRFAGVFQRWIQQQALEGLLIDVADYRHVFEGPAMVLIGHESDYTIEKRDGRLGLLYTHKRIAEPDLASQLRHSLRLALAACERLEKEKGFKPALRFDPNQIEFRFADRLRFPNRSETLDQVKSDLQTVLGELYGADVTLTLPDQDRRGVFTVETHGQAASLSELLGRLQPTLAK